MVTILNPSYESGYLTNWSFSASGAGQSLGNSATGVTDGTNAVFLRQAADAGRNIGDYVYSTQTITIDNDFTLFFDWYSGGNNKYSLIVLIDSTEELAIELSASGQNTDESVEITGYSGSHTLKVGVKCTSSTTTGETIYLDNFRVGEISQACQSTGLIYAGTQYNSSYINASIHVVEISPAGAHNQLCNITTPWGSTHNLEILEYEVLKTYSRSITGGTEYYTLYCTFVVYSESSGAIYTECWYTDLGNRYVKTTGSDSALGTTWGVAWKTMGYGFQNIPSSKDLYVEEGLYGGETLSNLNPPQTMSMNIQPSGHTEARCDIVITDDSVVTNFSVGGAINANIQNVTWLQLASSIAQNSTLYAIDMICGLSGYSGTFKFKVFRDDGTNYVFIGESEARTLSGASTDLIKIAFDGIEVLSGDLIAVSGGGAAPTIKFAISGTAAKFKVGDITTTSLKSSWTSGGSMNVGIKTYGV